MSFAFSPGFLLGTATSATQIEGGGIPHSWSDWYERGKIHDGSDPARAGDHFVRWKQDVDLMHSLGIKIYRLGIEWARIEPQEGQIDESAVAEYRALLEYLRALGIAPLLTLHHFTNPIWFEARGAFTRAENIPAFLSFVELAVERFGDLVDEYITINEPNVYAMMGYFDGVWPPGERSLPRTVQVMSVLAACHIRAYELVHRLRAARGLWNTKVSFAHHMAAFTPKSNDPRHRAYTRLVEHLFQGAITAAFYKGKFPLPLHRVGGVKEGVYADFIALNYYTRKTVSGLGGETGEGVDVNDLGWEIYPAGIVECAKKLYAALPRPIYITENGTCDNTDSFRARYLYDHLKALMDSGLPVARYYHWCFCDNFEWLEGESARFGLVHLDYETQIRTVKDSGHFYADMIANTGVTDDMFARYVAPQHYHK